MLHGACGAPGAAAAPPVGRGCTPGGRPAALLHMGAAPGTAQALASRRRAVAMPAVRQVPLLSLYFLGQAKWTVLGAAGGPGEAVAGHVPREYGQRPGTATTQTATARERSAEE